MGFLRSIKTNSLLRPIVSSRGSVTYGIAKVLAKILKLLMGKSPHHIHSTKDFVEMVGKVTLQTGCVFAPLMFTALFTFVLVDPTLSIIKELLEQDTSWWDRTVLSVQHIIELLGFCLHNTYFSFQNKFHEQVEGVAMGSPQCPIVANIYMKHFERKVPSTASTP